MRKNKKRLKKFIAPKLMIVETSGWRHLKENNTRRVKDMLQVFERGHLPIFPHSTPKVSPAYGKTVLKKI